LQSLFADDIAAWPIGLKLWSRSQYRELRLYLKYVSSWSEKWLLTFSANKSALVVFNHKRNQPPLPNPPLLLCGKPLPTADKYKYLGHTIDRNGSYKSHLQSVLQKVKYTAYLIGRVSSRYNMPSPSVICRITKAVLIPQMTYGLALMPLSDAMCSKMSQVIATPLRRALGLPRCASAARLLWEFGLYDTFTLHCKHIIAAYLRSKRCLDNGLTLAGTLANDHDTYVSEHSAQFCLPYPATVKEACACISLREPPADKNALKCALDKFATNRWRLNKREAVELKPQLSPASYLKIDRKPAVCIRARVRLGVALSFVVLKRYGKRESSTCDFCPAEGTIDHMLLHCPRFTLDRSICASALADLPSSPALTLDLLRGRIPPDLRKSESNQCLAITAEFLSAVSSKHFL